jgi:hypothetical protein
MIDALCQIDPKVSETNYHSWNKFAIITTNSSDFLQNYLCF